MTVAEVKTLLTADVLTGDDLLGTRLSQVCACDLMSDVLAFIKAGGLLLTGLTNPQVVRTAEVSEIHAICFVRGKQPPPETVTLAAEKGIPLLSTALSMYDSCGRLFDAGMRGC